MSGEAVLLPLRLMVISSRSRFNAATSAKTKITFNLNGTGALPISGVGCGSDNLSGYLPVASGLGTLIYKSNGNGTPGVTFSIRVSDVR